MTEVEEGDSQGLRQGILDGDEAIREAGERLLAMLQHSALKAELAYRECPTPDNWSAWKKAEAARATAWAVEVGHGQD